MRLLYRPAARRPRIRPAGLWLLLAALPAAGGAAPGSPLPASLPPVEIPLWPAAAPGSEALAAGQRERQRQSDQEKAEDSHGLSQWSSSSAANSSDRCQMEKRKVARASRSL